MRIFFTQYSRPLFRSYHFARFERAFMLWCFDAFYTRLASPPANIGASFREINASIRAAYLFLFFSFFSVASFHSRMTYRVERESNCVRLQK